MNRLPKIHNLGSLTKENAGVASTGDYHFPGITCVYAFHPCQMEVQTRKYSSACTCDRKSLSIFTKCTQPTRPHPHETAPKRGEMLGCASWLPSRMCGRGHLQSLQSLEAQIRVTYNTASIRPSVLRSMHSLSQAKQSRSGYELGCAWS